MRMQGESCASDGLFPLAGKLLLPPSRYRLARSETKRGDGCEEGFIVQLMAAAHAIMRLSPNEGGAITVTRNRMGRFLKGEGIAS